MASPPPPSPSKEEHRHDEGNVAAGGGKVSSVYIRIMNPNRFSYRNKFYWYTYALNNDGATTYSTTITTFTTTTETITTSTGVTADTACKSTTTTTCATGDKTKPLVPFSKTNHVYDSIVVGLGSIIYTLGGSISYGRDRKRSAIHHVYQFDTSNPHHGWISGPHMILPRLKPNTIALNGKLYVLGSKIDIWGDSEHKKDQENNMWRDSELEEEEEDGEKEKEKASIDDWAEFYDPSTKRWERLPVKLDSFNAPSLYSLLVPSDHEKDGRFKLSLAKIGTSKIMFVPTGSSPCPNWYIYDTIDFSLKAVKNPLIETNSHLSDYIFREGVMAGSMIYDICWRSGHLSGYSFDKFEERRGSRRIYGKHEYRYRDEEMDNDKKLMLPAENSCSDGSELVLVVWLDGRKGIGDEQRCIELHSRCCGFSNKTSNTAAKDDLYDVSIKFPKVFLLPTDTQLHDGLVLEGKLMESKMFSKGSKQ